MDTSALLDNYRFLAGYNRWFNGRLYDACERLPDEERKRDRGAFFGSIHGTLNHLVWGDRLWLQAICGARRRFCGARWEFARPAAGCRARHRAA